MNQLKALLAGLCGSLTLNILHRRTISLMPVAPGRNLLHEPVALDSFERINENLTGKNVDYEVNFLSNVVSNALLFSTVGFGKQKNFFGRGIILGLAAGIGAAKIPDRINLTNQQIEYRRKSNITTIALYVTGGLATAVVLSILRSKK